jgi:hypothetical protein
LMPTPTLALARRGGSNRNRVGIIFRVDKRCELCRHRKVTFAFALDPQ